MDFPIRFFRNHGITFGVVLAAFIVAIIAYPWPPSWGRGQEQSKFEPMPESHSKHSTAAAKSHHGDDIVMTGFAPLFLDMSCNNIACTMNDGSGTKRTYPHAVNDMPISTSPPVSSGSTNFVSTSTSSPTSIQVPSELSSHYVPEIDAIFASAFQSSTDLATSLLDLHEKHFVMVEWGRVRRLISPEKINFIDSVFSQKVTTTLSSISMKLQHISSQFESMSRREHACEKDAGNIESLCARMRIGKGRLDTTIHHLVDKYAQCRLDSLALHAGFQKSVYELYLAYESLVRLATEVSANSLEELFSNYGRGILDANGELWVSSFANELKEALKLAVSSDERFLTAKRALKIMQTRFIKLQGSKLREEVRRVM